MAYTPTNWQSGDVITSAKLNKLENGVSGAGGIVVEMTFGGSGSDVYYDSDMDASDIKDAYISGTHVVLHFNWDTESNVWKYADGEFYLPIINYQPASSNRGFDYEESFFIANMENVAHNPNATWPPTLTDITVTDSGKLRAFIYVD